MSRVQRLRYGMQMMTDLLGGNGIGMVPMRKWLYNQHWGSDSQLKRQQQSGMSVSISRVQTTGWRYRSTQTHWSNDTAWQTAAIRHVYKYEQGANNRVGL